MIHPCVPCTAFRDLTAQEEGFPKRLLPAMLRAACRLAAQALLAAGLLHSGLVLPSGWPALAARALIPLSAASSAFLAWQLMSPAVVHAAQPGEAVPVTVSGAGKRVD